MKRLVLLVMAGGALVILVPAAQTAPTSATGCTVEHISGAACQGPDVNAAADSCEINTWVGDASCVLTVSDGTADLAIAFTTAYSELQDTNWHAEAHVVVRDNATGQVLLTQDGSSTVPVSPGSLPPGKTLNFASELSPTGGAEVTCEVTGTHTPAGAPFSAQAPTAGPQNLNNVFNCRVS
jgi:hypothetical protein